MVAGSVSRKTAGETESPPQGHPPEDRGGDPSGQCIQKSFVFEQTIHSCQTTMRFISSLQNQARLTCDCDAELKRLPEEIYLYLQGELESKGSRKDLLSQVNNDSSGSGPSSNCSTPPYSSPNHSWSNIGSISTSLLDSPTSNSPVKSDTDTTGVY